MQRTCAAGAPRGNCLEQVEDAGRVGGERLARVLPALADRCRSGGVDDQVRRDRLDAGRDGGRVEQIAGG